MAGSWEFPGGKLEKAESRFDGLRRELHEEIGIKVEAARPLIRYMHAYPRLSVDLDVWRVECWRGEVHALEGQRLQWRCLDELSEIGLLPADGPIITALQLPDAMIVTPPTWRSKGRFLNSLQIGASSRPLICLRRPDLDVRSLVALAVEAADRLEKTDTRLVLHGSLVEIRAAISALPNSSRIRLRAVLAGFHVPARLVAELDAPPGDSSLLLGVSCHDRTELAAALGASADYAFLGPVKRTASHPGQAGMGWERFEELVRELPLPVYAIGGLGPEDLAEAWAHGAQGIAAIRSLWPRG
jgi:8-oxo-dGTP diphosphatase